MKKIQLTQGKVAIVDDDDYDELIKYKWYAHAMGRKKIFYYAVRHDTQHKLIRMHDTILQHTAKSLVVDHIDGDSLNNRRNNLRLVTPRQNCQNRHHEKTSKYCGVSRLGNRWRSQIRYLGKKRHLGLFKNEDDAHVVYLVADRVLVGSPMQEQPR